MTRSLLSCARALIELALLLTAVVVMACAACSAGGCKASAAGEAAGRIADSRQMVGDVQRISEPVEATGVSLSAAEASLLAGIDLLNAQPQWQRTFIEALSQVRTAQGHNKRAAEAVTAATKAARSADKQARDREKELAKARAEDPVRGWLQLGGFGALAVGTGLAVASIVGWLKAMPVAIAISAFGAVLVALARFLTVIEWLVFASLLAGVLCALGWGAWHVVRWLREEKAEDLKRHLLGGP